MSQHPQGATIFGCAGLALDAAEAAFFREADPWGFILFGRNVASPEQLRRLTGDLRAAVGRAAPVLIDQEGGRVQRLKPPLWRQWLPPLDQMAQCGPEAAMRAVWLRYRLIAAELRDAGIDCNCAPVVDVAGPATHEFLRNRCFGVDAGTVAAAARACAEGHLAGGVLPVVKHMPGHGRAGLDTHKALPRVGAARADLEAVDFAAFRALADLPLGMTAHIIYEAVDPELPATLSWAVIDVIRGSIGFDGLLMTDDINMHALSGSLAARSAGALSAGCDVVLHCSGDLAEMQEVAAASGRMTAVASARGAAALARRQTPEPAEIAALEAEFRALAGADALV